MMSRFLLLLLCASSLSAVQLDAADKPNFVIIFLDDVGYADLGCFGATKYQTPRLDQLAKEGTRFTSMYAQTVCGPSRGALLTGRYPVRIGGGWKTNGEEVTVAEVLKEAGYSTACIGKWDISQRRYQEGLVPNDQGFDYYFGTLGANDGGRVTFHRNREKLHTSNDMGALTKLYTDEAIGFLKKQKAETPFFLYLAHTMTHVVIDASPQFKGKSGGDLYGDVMQELDWNCGRVFDTLKELGFEKNTYVLFTSDNGPWNMKEAAYFKSHDGHLATGSAKPLRSGKGSVFEGGFREPCIVRGPGIPAGKISDGMISTLDVLPTFTALAGAKLPAGRKLDGYDQSAFLTGKSEKSARDRFFYHIRNELQAVRHNEWKLILPKSKLRYGYARDPQFPEAELYNLAKDIGESKNVAAEHPEIVARLSAMAKEVPSLGKK